MEDDFLFPECDEPMFDGITGLKVEDEVEEESEDYTLMSALEKIVITSRHYGMKDNKLAGCEKAIKHVMDRCGMNRIQAIFFAICIDQSMDPKIMVSDIRRWIDCPMISIRRHEDELDRLVEMGALIQGQPDNGRTYAVPDYVMTGLKRDEFVTEMHAKGLSIEAFFDKLGEIFNSRRNNLNFNTMELYINRLVSDNAHLAYCKKIMQLKSLKTDEVILLHFFCHRAVNHDDFYITESDYSGIPDTRSASAGQFRRLNRGCHPLQKLGLVEHRNSEGMGIPGTYLLTKKAFSTLLIETGVELSEDLGQNVAPRELVQADSIKEKKLFYTDKVAADTSRLASLLDQEQFEVICKRLERHGMRQGIACLFYGAPGTGKTETVKQLARLTGRAIMQVDISEMRSKWVGESEKMVKGLFERYRKAVETSKVAPILLLNEADALLTRRNPDSEHSVDKMENAMQNIFLQEIEGLRGILIATTNLTESLDPAFERRFIYKVRFEKPDAGCRAQIWKSMMPELSDDASLALAKLYDFSGGEIENITRKAIVDSILYGIDTPTLDTMRTYCDSERLHRRSRIGF